MAELAVLVFHMVAAASGIYLFFARKQILVNTRSAYFNLSPGYLKYAIVSLTTASSFLFILLQTSVLLFGDELGGIEWLWNLQAVGSVIGFCLVHLYFLRILGENSAGQTPP